MIDSCVVSESTNQGWHRVDGVLSALFLSSDARTSPSLIMVVDWSEALSQIMKPSISEGS